MAKKYGIDPKYLAKHPSSFTVVMIPGAKPKRVAIGDGNITVPAGIGGPEQKLTIPNPTQQELKILFEAGVSYVIEIDEQASFTKKAKDEDDE